VPTTRDPMPSNSSSKTATIVPVGSVPLAAEPGFGPFHAFPAEALFAGIAVFAAIGALSFESERPFSAAIVYVGFGIAGAVGLELLDFGWLTLSGDAAVIRHVAEFALIVALFGTGVIVESPLRPSTWRVVAALILVAMPLTIAAVTAFGPPPTPSLRAASASGHPALGRAASVREAVST
jgi:hypothetical protein